MRVREVERDEWREKWAMKSILNRFSPRLSIISTCKVMGTEVWPLHKFNYFHRFSKAASLLGCTFRISTQGVFCNALHPIVFEK